MTKELLRLPVMYEGTAEQNIIARTCDNKDMIELEFPQTSKPIYRINRDFLVALLSIFPKKGFK